MIEEKDATLADQLSDDQPGSRDRIFEGTDYYVKNGLMVLTAKFLAKRGYCCLNGCRHCPYPEEERKDHNR